MGHVYSYKRAGFMDNVLRRFIHNPQKLFGKYVSPGMKVLDIGCGAGFASIGLAKMVGTTGSVTSVDLQQEMLDILKTRAEKAGVSSIIRTHKSAGDTLGVEGKFDFVVAFYMVHEVPDRMMFLSEVFSLLKEDGLFFIAEPSNHVPFSDFEKLLKIARELGYKAQDNPSVLFSHAIVLEKVQG